jgi:MFS family permease
MNALGASPLLLSLIATAASLPFFLLTLPAGALADLGNRRNLLITVYLWLAAAAGLLAVCTWLNWVHPYFILITVFLLAIGFAFNAPVWASVIPEIVRKQELASAITLGGVQVNLAGIVGPALGGLLLPVIGPACSFPINAVAFLVTAAVITPRNHPRRDQKCYGVYKNQIKQRICSRLNAGLLVSSLLIQTRFWLNGKSSGCSGRNESEFCENISLPPFPRAGLFLLPVYWQTV